MKTKLLTLLALGCTLLAVACAMRRVSHDYIFDVTGVVTAEDNAPVQDAEVTLEVNGPVYEAITPVKTVKQRTNITGGFVFMYISHERGVKYMLTVHKDGFEPEIVSGSSPPTGNHVIRLRKEWLKPFHLVNGFNTDKVPLTEFQGSICLVLF